MPLEDRLRTAFDRTSESVDPAVEASLDATIRRASRREPLPLGGFVVAALAVVVIVVGVRYLLPSGGQLGGAGASPTLSANPGPDFGRISGLYQVALTAADSGVSGLGLAGEWQLTLHANGGLDLTAPPTFAGSRAAGHSFSIEGPTFRTDLYYNDYCNGLGSYEWSLTADGLSFEPIDDQCEIRRVLLSTRQWISMD